MKTLVTSSYVIILVLMTLATEGFCACSWDNISIGTVRSGRDIGGMPEWTVTVVNNCPCPQSQIKLSCPGFQSAENIDPSIFLKQDDNTYCLLINGNPLQPSASVTFSYAWDPPFLLLPSGCTRQGCGC